MKELLILAATSFGLGVGAPPGDFRDCESGSSPTLRIEACSRIVDQKDIDEGTRAIVHWHRGTAYYDAGRADEALAEHDKSIELNPDFVMAYVTRGTIFESEGELDRALADFNKAMSMNENAGGYVLRAGVYLSKGETEKAFDDYSRAIELDPTFAPGHAGRGNANLQLENFDAAIADFDRALALKPEDAFSLARRGIAHAGRGFWPNALADYEAALKIEPANTMALSGRGYAFAQTGQFDRAIEDIGRVEEILAPGADRLEFGRLFMAIHLPGTLDARAYAHMRKGQPELALSDYDSLIKYTKPPDWTLYGSRARVFDMLADHERAIADYNQALELGATDESIHYDIGRVHFRKGDFGAAVEQIKRYPNPDGYAMLWLFLAQSRNGEDGMKDLNASAEGASREWPFVLVELYLGQSSADQVYAAAKDDGQRCEADFYVAQWNLLKGDTDSAKRRLQAAVDTCWKTYIEYPAAVAELKRMD